MAGESDKQVRLSFAVDTASVQRAKQAIGELITEATTLVNVLKQANLGNIGGGGGGMSVLSDGGLVDQHNRPMGNATSVATQSPLQGIGTAVVGNAQALKGVATAGVEALRNLSDAARISMLDQGRNIDTLQGKLNTLLSTYGQLGGVSSTALSPPGGEDAYTGLFDADGRRITSSTGSKKMPYQPPGLSDPKAPSSESGLQATAISSGVGKAITIAAAIAGARMALGAGETITGQFGPSGMASQAGIMAGQGKLWGGAYQAAYGQQDIGIGFKSLFMGGGLRGQGAGYDKYSNIMEHIKNSQNAADWAITLKDAKSLGLNMRDVGWEPERAQMLREQAMADVTEDMAKSTGLPTMTAINRFSSQLGTQVGLERQYGYGGGYWKTVNGVRTRSSEAELKAATAMGPMGQGLSFDYKDPLHDRAIALADKGVLQYEDAAAAEAVRMSGAKSAQWRIAGAIAAGGAWSGAAGLAGQAAIGGASGRFLGGVMGMGGLDAAAMGMGGVAAGTLGAAGVQTSGLGLLGAMQRGFGTTGGENDLWNVREAQGGTQLMGGVFGGGLDQYQQAVNFANAGAAFGGGDMSRQQYLSTVFGKDPNLVADILSPNASAATKKWMANHGITKAEVAEFVKTTGASLIGRAAAQETGADPGQRAILAVQQEAGGDIGKYMKMHHIAKGSKKARNLAELLGAGGAETGISDDASWAGFIKTETGFGADLATGSRGGVKSASRGELLRQQKEQAKLDKEVDEKMGTIKLAADALAPATTAFGTAVKELEANADDLGAAFEWLTRKAYKSGGLSEGGVDEFIAQERKRRADAKATPPSAPNAKGAGTGKNHGPKGGGG